MIVRHLPWLLPLAFLIAGCEMSPPKEDASNPTEEQKSAANTWMVNSIRDAGISAGILTQHTLFAYHFETGRETLNPLGERDLAVLAGNFKLRPGQLNVRRGDVSEDLYKTRLDYVNRRLADAGVEVARLKIVDAPAGGPGMPSERAIKILQQAEAADASSAGATSGSSSGSTGSSQGSVSQSMTEVPK